MALWKELDTMQIQTNKAAYDCHICDNVFPSPIQLTIHCIVAHRLVPCTHCLKLFENKASVDDHKCTHHSEPTESAQAQLLPANQKMCELCELCISVDAFQPHRHEMHKINNLTPKRLSIAPDNQNQFHCHLCDNRKSMNGLDKLFSHFIFFHKYSLQSLIRCILNTNGIESIRSIQICDDVTANCKCTECGIAYTWSIPKIYHKIYCHGHVFCAACTSCFDNQQQHDEHFGRCADQTIKSAFCDNCSSENNADIKNLHNISSLLDSQNYCNLCKMNLNTEATNLNDVIEHFHIVHQLNAMTMLRYLKKRQNVQLNTNHQHRGEHSAVRVKDEIEIKVEVKKEDEDENVQYVMDFDAKIIKYIYSSESDYDSNDSSDEQPQNPNSFQCELCNSRTKSKFAHATHMHKKHGFSMKPFRFRCNVCRKNYASNHGLKKHFQNIHHKRNAAKRFVCPFCTFACDGKWKMRQHISEHVESTYHPCYSKSIGFNCKYCHFVFWTKDKLSEHELCRHSEQASDTYLLCQYCSWASNNLVS